MYRRSRVFVFVFVFAAMAYGAERKSDQEIEALLLQCVDASGLPHSEFQHEKILFTSPPGPVLCAGKCILENLEIVDSNHDIVTNTLVEYIKEFPEEMKSRTLQCAAEIKRIEKCEDMETYRVCVEEVYFKYLKNVH